MALKLSKPQEKMLRDIQAQCAEQTYKEEQFRYATLRRYVQDGGGNTLKSLKDKGLVTTNGFWQCGATAKLTPAGRAWPDDPTDVSSEASL